MTKEFLRGMTAGVSERDGDGTGICIFFFLTVINTGISCSIMLICKKNSQHRYADRFLLMICRIDMLDDIKRRDVHDITTYKRACVLLPELHRAAVSMIGNGEVLIAIEDDIAVITGNSQSAFNILHTINLLSDIRNT